MRIVAAFSRLLFQCLGQPCCSVHCFVLVFLIQMTGNSIASVDGHCNVPLTVFTKNAAYCSLKDRHVSEIVSYTHEGLQDLQPLVHLDIIVGMTQRVRRPSYKHNLRRSFRRRNQLEAKLTSDHIFGAQLPSTMRL